MQALKKKRARLFLAVCQSLTEKNVRIEDVAHYVRDLHVKIPSSSFHKIFQALRSNGLWNFLSCELLWSIFDGCLPKDRELLRQVEEYKFKLDQFKRNTTVSFIPIVRAELSPEVNIFDQQPPVIQNREHYRTYSYEGDVDHHIEGC